MPAWAYNVLSIIVGLGPGLTYLACLTIGYRQGKFPRGILITPSSVVSSAPFSHAFNAVACIAVPGIVVLNWRSYKFVRSSRRLPPRTTAMNFLNVASLACGVAGAVCYAGTCFVTLVDEFYPHLAMHVAMFLFLILHFTCFDVVMLRAGAETSLFWQDVVLLFIWSFYTFYGLYVIQYRIQKRVTLVSSSGYALVGMVFGRYTLVRQQMTLAFPTTGVRRHKRGN